jgi:hypothetical protein
LQLQDWNMRHNRKIFQWVASAMPGEPTASHRLAWMFWRAAFVPWEHIVECRRFDVDTGNATRMFMRETVQRAAEVSQCPEAWPVLAMHNTDHQGLTGILRDRAVRGVVLTGWAAVRLSSCHSF